MAELTKCPLCVEEGKKSKLFCHGSMTTLAGGPPNYYDEEEKLHVHDPNRTTRSYTCSNGHNFSHMFYHKCPNCDYNADKQDEISPVVGPRAYRGER